MHIRLTLCRHLLTHTSGFAYEFNEPLLQEWRRQQPDDQRGSRATLLGRFQHPLLYEPGQPFLQPSSSVLNFPGWLLFL